MQIVHCVDCELFLLSVVCACSLCVVCLWFNRVTTVRLCYCDNRQFKDDA